MRRRAVSGILLTLLLLDMLMLTLNIQSAEAPTSPYSPAGGIQLSPPSITYFIDSYCYYNNTKFNVDVIVTNITGCAGYQFKIDYNATLLKFDSWTFDTDPAHPLSPAQMAPASGDRVDINASLPGKVQLSTVWKVYVPRYTYAGNSTAARLTFKIIYCPYCPLGQPWPGETVSTPIAFNRTKTKAVDNNGDDILFATFGDSYYEYTTTPAFGPHMLAVSSSPSGVTFTVDGAPHTTPWSDWLDYGIDVTVVMPETHDEYVWDRWSYGSTNRTVTTPMFTHVDLTALYQPPPAVGGIPVPVNHLALVAPYVGLTILLAIAVVTVVYGKRRKRELT